MNTSRRTFLRQATAASIGFAGLNLFACNSDQSHTAARSTSLLSKGYGPLKPDPNKLFDLPEGFSYKVVSRWGQTMDDGLLIPNRADGMATFTVDNKMVLVRNHELSTADLKSGAFGETYEWLSKIPQQKFYDYGKGEMPALGGTTTMVFDETSQQVENQFMSLAGTIRNCAGGPTPWGSWITCEETVEKIGENQNERDHGYNFEVPATTQPSLAEPVPLKEMGRFNHEAVCVDPGSGIVYQTEDRGDGLIYRFIPKVPGELQKGGKLQVLAIKGEPSRDTRNWQEAKTQSCQLARTWM